MKGEYDFDSPPPLGECWVCNTDNIQQVVHVGNHLYEQRHGGKLQSVMFVHPTRIATSLEYALKMLKQSMMVMLADCQRSAAQTEKYLEHFNVQRTYLLEHP